MSDNDTLKLATTSKSNSLALGATNHNANLNEHIWASYYTTKPDPQRNLNWTANNFGIISDWYNSIRPISANAKIFYDSLSDEFIRHFSTTNISFEKNSNLPWSTNDSRFLAYLSALHQLYDDDVIFLTDISDVTIVNHHYLENVRDDQIYLGNDIDTTPLVGQNSWMVAKTKGYLVEAPHFNFDPKFLEAKLYNAGIIGGKVRIVRKFLKKVVGILEHQVHENNFNMFAVNYAAFQFQSAIEVSSPTWLASKFKKNEARLDVLFKHK